MATALDQPSALYPSPMPSPGLSSACGLVPPSLLRPTLTKVILKEYYSNNLATHPSPAHTLPIIVAAPLTLANGEI